MGLWSWMRRCCGVAGLALAHAGCVNMPPRAEAPAPAALPASPAQPAAPAWEKGPVVTIVHKREAAPPPPPQAAPPAPPALFAGAEELDVDAVVARVLERSPTVALMAAAWQAASARYPQVTSLDDPLLGVQAAPGAWGSRGLDGGVRVELSQKYPWCGKLGLRGENAQALAQAAGHDVADAKLQLVESARRAFYDYYLVDRALAVNRENLRLLRDFRARALVRYENRLAPEQDFRQAEVEIGRAQERQVGLERLRPAVVARINTLMHLPPDGPLPPPPEKAELGEALPEAVALRALAVQRRPDLMALAERIRAERAGLGLAHLEFYPDIEVLAAFDSIWQEKPLRGQVGLRLNLPVRTERRWGAVAEAQARLGQRVAELSREVDQLNYQVQQAHEQVRESEQVVRLYEKTVLPAARQNVKAALAGYETSRVPFLSLIEAQRNVTGLQDRYYEAIAEYHRRRATLERAIGGPATPPPVPEAKPAMPRKPDAGRP